MLLDFKTVTAQKWCLLKFFFIETYLNISKAKLLQFVKFICYTKRNQIIVCIGNLALNEPCSFSEQCLGSPNASCLGRKCSCIEGYTAKESTHCVQSIHP